MARVAISLGGFGTIGAVLLVCGFLVWVVWPLFLGSGIEATSRQAAPATGELHEVDIDPYRQLVWRLDDQGVVRMLSMETGAEIASAQAVPDGYDLLVSDNGWLLSGDELGSVVLAEVRIDDSFLRADLAPDSLADLEVGVGQALDNSWYFRTPDGWRRSRLVVEAGDPIAMGDSKVLVADVTVGEDSRMLAAILADGSLAVRQIELRENPFDPDQVETSVSAGGLRLADLTERTDQPAFLSILGDGDNALLIWADGSTLRFDSRDPEELAVVEQLDLLADPTASVVGISRLIGRNTLLVADSAGLVHSFFRTKPKGARGTDGAQLDLVHEFGEGGSPVVSMSPSRRSRMFAVGHADGKVRVWHGTSERLVAETSLADGEPLLHVVFAPKEDGLLVATAGSLHPFDLAAGHPEVTLAALATPVWYEGYEKPQHVWQSTGGTDEFEPKLGLWPLIFGTIKATFYCLLFGVPLALLAAIYTSEFLQPRYRSRIKPLVETMASLPSVVLGFLAGLVFAPFVEHWLMTLLSSLVTVPVVWLLGSQFVAGLGSVRRVSAERLRLLLLALTLPVAMFLAVQVGDLLENTMFGGDFQAWLSETSVAANSGTSVVSGSAFGGWFLALFPVGALLATLLVGRLTLFRGVRFDGVLRVLTGLGLAVLATILGAFCMTEMGFDLRGSLLDTYIQRNALVVGIVMGFAVIPIIYTIAEDALSAVPEHLRAASLGAGATPWQTATRIVLPTAMSGVFSAVMVGLGRAVGETMVVLMATGNTPVLELNPFSGLRTLSANIAIELPEAVRDSAHYRTLYLAALVLFAMTFVLNSCAEVVRQRFRRRAWQL